MTRLFALTALLSGAAALAACERVPETNGATPEAATAADGGTPAAAAPAGPAAARFTPGNWQMTTSIQNVSIASTDPAAQQAQAAMRQALVGKPQMQDVCVSQAEADQGLPKLFVPPGNDCTVERSTLANGMIDIAYQCRDPSGQAGTIRTTGTYSADTIRTSTDIRATGPDGGAITMRAATQGQRLGDC